MKKFILLAIISLCFATNSIAQNELNSSDNIRLYTLSCGFLNIHDGYSFSDTGYYPHKPLYVSDPCFLIKHPKGWLLWDAGLGDKYFIGKPVEDKKHGLTMNVPISVTSQLKEIGLTPKDIKYLALSHTHFDHVGNASLFPDSTLLIQRSEYNSLMKKHLLHSQESSTLGILKPMNKVLLDGNYDVFKDGTVVIIKTPGHTVGHQSLELKLRNSGTVILSGDLYHTRDAYIHKLVPMNNVNRTDTLASMSKMDKILKDSNGKIVIQHDINDYNSLPKFPKYLD